MHKIFGALKTLIDQNMKKQSRTMNTKTRSWIQTPEKLS